MSEGGCAHHTGSAPPAPVLRAHFADASGGLGYHLRALRFRHSLWAPYIATVQRWLHDWRPPTDTLVVVGPSAGYALDAAFLARFRSVRALEPDPLARFLLRRRFAQIAWHFDRLDCLHDGGGPGALAAAYPQAAILFANVLGQALDPALLPAWRGALADALRLHHWASWHDVLSAGTAPLPADDLDPAAFRDATALARALWRTAVEVSDHDTFALAPQGRALASWRIAPAQWQVVEWGMHRPADAHSAAPPAAQVRQ